MEFAAKLMKILPGVLMTAIDRILQSYRDAAVTEREKGTYFERLGLAFFLSDPIQAEEYEAVLTWSEWAKANGRDGKDVGIDLIAKLRNEDGWLPSGCGCARHLAWALPPMPRR